MSGSYRVRRSTNAAVWPAPPMIAPNRAGSCSGHASVRPRSNRGKERVAQCSRPWQCLYFLPEPQGQGALRGYLAPARAAWPPTGALPAAASTGRCAWGAAARPGRARRRCRSPRAAPPRPSSAGHLLRLRPDLEMREHLRHRLAQVGQHALEQRRTPRACTRSAGRAGHSRAGGCPGADGRDAAGAPSTDGRGSAAAGSSRPSASARGRRSPPSAPSCGRIRR